MVQLHTLVFVVIFDVLFLAHTTQFTKPGDVYMLIGSGSGHLNSGGTYVSLMDPDTKDLTIIIETMVRLYITFFSYICYNILLSTESRSLKVYKTLSASL